MEVLQKLEKAEVKMFSVSAVIETAKTVKRNVTKRSADPRAGKFTADEYAEVAFITVKGKTEYFCHTSNGIEEAVQYFKDGGWKKYLPKL